MDLDAYVAAAAGLVGLEVPEASRAEVVRFLALAAEMAAVLDAAPLDDGELALAPVFSPPVVTPPAPGSDG